MQCWWRYYSKVFNFYFILYVKSGNCEEDELILCLWVWLCEEDELFMGEVVVVRLEMLKIWNVEEEEERLFF